MKQGRPGDLHSNRVQCGRAIEQARVYADFAALQSARIRQQLASTVRTADRFFAAVEKGVSGDSADNVWVEMNAAIYVDVHLYLILWAQVELMLTHAADKCRCGGDALRPFRADLNHYRRGRDHFEHLDQRLAGGEGKRKSKILANPWDAGNITWPLFTFNAESWDISESSAQKLQSIVRAFSDACASTLRMDSKAR